MKDTSTCCTCGYIWSTGQDGNHSCSITLVEKIEDIRKYIEHEKSVYCSEPKVGEFSFLGVREREHISNFYKRILEKLDI